MNWEEWAMDKAPFLAIIIVQFRLIFMLLKPLFTARSIEALERMRRLVGLPDDTGSR